MTGWPWLGAACALLAWPPASSARRRSAPSDGVRRQRITTVLALAGGAALSLGVLGPARGLVAAGLVCPALVWALRRGAGQRVAASDPSVALTLDLAASVLRAGRPVPEALMLAAPAAAPATAEAFTRTARLLALGADPALAWAGGDPAGRPGPLAPVAQAAVRSHVSGVRLADTFERLAGELRAEHAASALARAQRAGTQALGPLAACFLPSFVCLGIVPVVVGVARTVLGSVTG